jgi:transcriptional regulator with XRE-family HTH domain
MAGVSRGQLRQMENGENVSLQFLTKVATALELTELPVGALRLRAAPLELAPIVEALDAVATAKRAIEQAREVETLLAEAGAVLETLVERALAETASSRDITEAAHRMLNAPAAMRRSPPMPAQHTTEDAGPAARRRSRS